APTPSPLPFKGEGREPEFAGRGHAPVRSCTPRKFPPYPPFSLIVTGRFALSGGGGEEEGDRRFVEGVAGAISRELVLQGMLHRQDSGECRFSPDLDEPIEHPRHVWGIREGDVVAPRLDTCDELERVLLEDLGLLVNA